MITTVTDTKTGLDLEITIKDQKIYFSNKANYPHDEEFNVSFRVLDKTGYYILLIKCKDDGNDFVGTVVSHKPSFYNSIEED
jgi:hypothetical protein